jgi:hypothetical protein
MSSHQCSWRCCSRHCFAALLEKIQGLHSPCFLPESSSLAVRLQRWRQPSSSKLNTLLSASTMSGVIGLRPGTTRARRVMFGASEASEYMYYLTSPACASLSDPSAHKARPRPCDHRCQSRFRRHSALSRQHGPRRVDGPPNRSDPRGGRKERQYGALDPQQISRRESSTLLHEVIHLSTHT